MAVSAELDHIYAVATGELSTEVKTRAETLERTQLSPSTVVQARHYIQIAGLDPDKEKLLLNSYGILRENRFPVPPGQEEAAHTVNKLGDQRQFALALLLSEKHTEFDQFVQHFPNIFDSSVKK
jgi:hypothetical protein